MKNEEYINDYYEEIKRKIIDVESIILIKNYSINKKNLNNYYEIGKLIIEKQNTIDDIRKKDKVIEEYSKNLMEDLNDKYNSLLLKKIIKFYYLVEAGIILSYNLSWDYYEEILLLKSVDEINYYLICAMKNNLSVKQLRRMIKNKEYELV